MEKGTEAWLNYDGVKFACDESQLRELEVLWNLEIDALVDQRLLPKENRWNPDCRRGFTLNAPEMVSELPRDVSIRSKL